MGNEVLASGAALFFNRLRAFDQQDVHVSNGALARWTIATSGTVVLTAGSSVYATLDGIAFLVT